jgi:hypothetical protein
LRSAHFCPLHEGAATTLKREWINDWSLTEVGMAVAPTVDGDEYADDYRYNLAGKHFGVLSGSL